jgi:hypothetical protein
MTKRELRKSSRTVLSRFSITGFIGLIAGLISTIFSLPKGQTMMNLFTINIQLVALIFSIIGFSVFIAWIIFIIRHIYLELTTMPEVVITGENIWGQTAEIKIDNKEPVDLTDIYIKLVRFCWNRSVWNDVKSLTGMTANNFFSKGLVEASRTVSRSPVFVNIAKAIDTKNRTKLLLDNHSAYMPLNEKSETLAEHEYELVFEITGRFKDDNKSILLGQYYGRLFHEQIQAAQRVARQDNFKWKELYKTSDKRENILKAEREKQLSFSFPLTES